MRAPRPATGTLAEVGDGTFLLTDEGIPFDFPGSGYVYRMGGNLETLARIDATTVVGGRLESPTATVTRDVVVDPGLGVAWVVSGTGRRGPLFPIQPPRILEVDLERNEVSKVLDAASFRLGTLGPVQPCAAGS